MDKITFRQTYLVFCAIFIAAITERTYKYKLAVKENKAGITHYENSDYCNGLGLMWVIYVKE